MKTAGGRGRTGGEAASFHSSASIVFVNAPCVRSVVVRDSEIKNGQAMHVFDVSFM